MTNGTPSAQRTNAPQPIDISEAGTVERAIQIEDRMAEIITMLERKEGLWQVAIALGLSPLAIEQKIEDLESELSDLQREYRG